MSSSSDSHNWRDSTIGRALAAGLLVAALVVPGLVDLAFVGRIGPGPTIAALASTGVALAVCWCCAAPLGLGFLSRRLPVPPVDREKSFPTLGAGLAISAPAAVLLGAGGWMLAGPLFDPSVTGGLPSDAGLRYLRPRLLALPAFAALLVLAEHLLKSAGRTRVLVAVVVLNLANLALNALFASVPGLPGSVFGRLAAATGLATGLSALLLVGLLARRRDPPGWSLAGWRRFVDHSRSPLFVWLIALAAFIGILTLVGLADQVAMLDAVKALRPPAGTDLAELFGDRFGTALLGDWPTAVARSRPSLYLASSSILVALTAPWLMLAFGMAATPDRELRAGTVAILTSLGAGAVAQVVIPEWFVLAVTSSPEVVATTVPALRLLAAHLPFAGIAAFILSIQLTTEGGHRAEATVAVGSLAAPGFAAVVGLVFSLGFMGIWWGVVIATVAMAGTSTLLFWPESTPEDA